MGVKMRALHPAEQRLRINNILARFEIGPLSNRYPYELSGGQKQRAALAITLLNEPRVLLLDEPTTFVDGSNRLAIWNFIENEIRPLSIPTILVTHDPVEALTLGDKICVLGDNSRIIDEFDVFFPHPRSEQLSREESFWNLKRRVTGEPTGHP
jgi:ABC-type nitrate/sulfonate/bicarbonate transport system ATPase subunit